MVVMSIASAQRISEVINEKSTLHNPAEPDYEIKDGSIDFNNVNFSYFDDQEEINLRDINVHIKSGQTIGIIGGTGSAKSTFVQLIPRLYDVTKGEVLVGGKDVRKYDLETLRNEVAMVLQKNVLDVYKRQELAHVEMISAILYQLTTDLTIDQIKAQGYDKYFVDHTLGIYPQGASNVPFTAAYFQSKGDPITDLTEDMAAEQKARTTYDNILALVDDEEIKKPIRFLREREIIHYQRFAEALELSLIHI